MADLLQWTNPSFLDQEFGLKDPDLKDIRRKQTHSELICHERAKVRNPKRFYNDWNFIFPFDISNIHNSCTMGHRLKYP
jgi:hypothetical protein